MRIGLALCLVCILAPVATATHYRAGAVQAPAVTLPQTGGCQAAYSAPLAAAYSAPLAVVYSAPVRHFAFAAPTYRQRFAVDVHHRPAFALRTRGFFFRFR